MEILFAWVVLVVRRNGKQRLLQLRLNAKKSSLLKKVKEKLSVLIDDCINSEGDSVITGRPYSLTACCYYMQKAAIELGAI